MEKVVLKALAVITGVVFMISIAGCEDEQQIPTAKKNRLIAAENMQLKQQLQQRKVEIEKLKGQHAAETQMQKEVLEKCQQEKKVLQEQLGGKFDEDMAAFFGDLGGEIKRLEDENRELMTQIEELKTKLENLKKAQ